MKNIVKETFWGSRTTDLASVFDLGSVKPDMLIERPTSDTVIAYFTAPRDWLGNQFENAIASDLRIEYDKTHPDADHAFIGISPVFIDEFGNAASTDWMDVFLMPEQISSLIAAVRHEQVDALRWDYPIGSQIVLDKMDDPQAPPAGSIGTVRWVDDLGQIHVSWNTGGTLALIPEADLFHKLNDGGLAV